MNPRLYLVAIVLASLTLTLVPAQDPVLEPSRPGEELFADPDAQDQSFDDSLLSEEEKPKTDPVLSEVESDYAYFIDASEPGTYSEVATYVNLTSATYLTYAGWYTPYYGCCPRCQNYDCASHFQLHRCFYHLGSWCCPFYPNYLYIANCNCRECVKQCNPSSGSGCFALGYCRRRYTLRRFWAVCWNGAWKFFRYVSLYLPSSCYCHANC